MHGRVVNRENGLGLFQVDRFDFVAARNAKQAIDWYLWREQIGENDPDLLPRPNEINLDTTLNYVDNSNSPIRSTTYRKLIMEAIADQLQFPCILATLEYDAPADVIIDDRAVNC